MARSTFPSQNVQNTPLSDHFWKLRCRKSARCCGAKHISKSKCTKHTRCGPLLEEKVHVVVARSTCPSKNAQNTPGADHFWKLRCRKSVWRCGTKHISKSKCTKHTILGPLLEVQMSKKCTALWREAHTKVKMLKTQGVRTTFGGSDVASLHYTTLHYTTLRSTTLHYITLHYTPKHYNYNYTTTLHYTPLHQITLHYITLYYITLHYLPLHFTTLHYTMLHYNYNYTTILHYTPLHSTTLRYITLHYITLNDTAPQIDR